MELLEYRLVKFWIAFTEYDCCNFQVAVYFKALLLEEFNLTRAAFHSHP
jgi:hypothetical protein